MKLREFSDQFDTMLNSYAQSFLLGEPSSKAEIVLDEYEKSVFLTQAQEGIVVNIYNGRNPYGESFESTEEMRRYLSNLVFEDSMSPNPSNCGITGVSNKSFFFSLPDNLWFITYESVVVTDGRCGETTLDVLPVTQDEYNKIKRNPFRGANGRRALRLDFSDGTIEIVCKNTVSSYYIRYVKKVAPIILVDLPDGLSINGESGATECELHEALHKIILEDAVMRALRSRGSLKENKQ